MFDPRHTPALGVCRLDPHCVARERSNAMSTVSESTKSEDEPVTNKSSTMKSEPHRIQFQFSPEAYTRLNDLRDRVEATSYAELVRNALRIYEWVLDQEKEGYSFALIKDDKLVKEIKFVL